MEIYPTIDGWPHEMNCWVVRATPGIFGSSVEDFQNTKLTAFMHYNETIDLAFKCDSFRSREATTTLVPITITMREETRGTNRAGVAVFGIFNDTPALTQCPNLHIVSLKALGQVNSNIAVNSAYPLPPSSAKGGETDSTRSCGEACRN